MLRQFLKQFDGLTIALIASLCSITAFAIGAINYVFVDRVLLNDAKTLSYSAANEIHQELFQGTGLGSYIHLNQALSDKHNIIGKHSLRRNNIGDDKNRAPLAPLTFKPHNLTVDSQLKKFVSTHLNTQSFMHVLDGYAIYLPNGNVYLSNNLYNNPKKRADHARKSEFVNSVQNVFLKGTSVYSFHETPEKSYTRYFIPLKRSGETLAVVLLEAHNTTASNKMANAVTSAVYLTAFAGLPVLMLVMYLVWSHLRQNQKAQEELSFLTHHDKLTSLLNRAGFYETISNLSRVHKSPDERAAVFLIDLDDFHSINSDVGEMNGDHILLEVVKRLNEVLPSNAILSRLAADEFVVILPDVSIGEDAAAYAKLMKDRLAVPHEFDDGPVSSTCSIGIVFMPDNGKNGETLLNNAKLALYRSKMSGGNTFRFFEPEMDKELQDKRTLVRDLGLALKDEQYEIYYQPQVELCGRVITGYEALLRWNHPERGMISPAEFIPVLEETKMIVEVGEYVLRRACQEALTWNNGEKVAVNLSPVQSEHQNVPLMVQKILDETGLPAERLEIEITESILMSDTDKAIEMLDELKKIGVNIAMDDFGTGYSSLSYISQFEFDKIKIDRSFVSSIQTDERARAIITTVIGLGRTLDIMITAEGIETHEQLLLIQAAGCHFGQGYLFGKPVPLSEIQHDNQNVQVTGSEKQAIFRTQVA